MYPDKWCHPEDITHEKIQSYDLIQALKINRKTYLQGDYDAICSETIKYNKCPRLTSIFSTFTTEVRVIGDVNILSSYYNKL